MAMVVQHNLTAMNSNRMLGITMSGQAKSSEKLSSGYKINRAADDAAGLTISEKMRKQIRGLDRGSTNAQDGVSAVQTAEGALTEVHSMLQRMNELAVQASNGTNSTSDRQALQDEINQLTTEIDRVAETTKFNEMYLLKGNAAGVSTTKKVAAHDAGLKGKLTDNGGGVSTFQLDKALSNGDKVTIAGKEYQVGAAGNYKTAGDLNDSTDGYKLYAAGDFDNKVLSVGDSVTYSSGGQTKTVTLVNKVGVDQVAWADGDQVTIGDTVYKVKASSPDAAQNEYTAANLKVQINNALAAGQQVRALTSDKLSVITTKDSGTANGTTATQASPSAVIQIVSALEAGEISSVMLASTKAATIKKAAEGETTTTAVTLKAGDSITEKGKTPVVATANEPSSAKDVYNAIMASTVVAGDKVKIGTGVNAKEYEVVAKEEDVDTAAFKLTKDMILSKIKDQNVVNVDGGGAKTVIGDIALPDKADTIISARQAYDMMAKELQKASSIGTDTAATVANNGNGKFTITQGSVEVKDVLSFSLHVGADADMTNKITVDMDAMSAAGLGIKGITIMGANGSDDGGAAATYAIDAIADAVAKVSAQRSALGAVQNRLEHTIANLDNIVENTTSAESRIRDTDMAKEMVEYSKNNILAQAGQSMLAQANQNNQGVLSLLR